MTPVKHKQRFNRAGENTKEKKNFVLSKFRAFVINHFGFPDKSGFTLRSNRFIRLRVLAPSLIKRLDHCGSPWVGVLILNQFN